MNVCLLTLAVPLSAHPSCFSLVRCVCVCVCMNVCILTLAVPLSVHPSCFSHFPWFSECPAVCPAHFVSLSLPLPFCSLPLSGMQFVVSGRPASLRTQTTCFASAKSKQSRVFVSVLRQGDAEKAGYYYFNLYTSRFKGTQYKTFVMYPQTGKVNYRHQRLTLIKV